MIFEVELALERARRNALVKIRMFRRWTCLAFGLATRHSEPVLLRRNGDLVR